MEYQLRHTDFRLPTHFHLMEGPLVQWLYEQRVQYVALSLGQQSDLTREQSHRLETLREWGGWVEHWQHRYISKVEQGKIETTSYEGDRPSKASSGQNRPSKASSSQDRPSKASSSQKRQAKTVRQDPVASGADRFWAALFDSVYLGIAGYFAVLFALDDPYTNDRLWAPVAVLIVFVWLECMAGAKGKGSLGKRTVGLRVQPWKGHRGDRPSHLGRFLMRTLILAIPILNLVCLVAMALDSHHRAWYDEMAGTVVVKVR